MTTLNTTPQFISPQEDLADKQGDERERGFHKFLWYSTAFHIMILILVAVRAYISPSEQIPLESVIRVDIVGLPDKSKPAVKPVETASSKPVPVDTSKPDTSKPELPKLAAPTPKEETPKVNLNKTKQAQEAALTRLQAIEKLKSAMNEEAIKDAAESSRSNSANKTQPLVKGNEISSGSALRGIAKQNYVNYQETAHDHIRKFWNLPHWLSNANLSCKVRVWIDAQGNILRKELTSKSQQPAFDERALHALGSASPLPPPPSALATLVAVEGVEIEFVPER